MTTLVPVGKRFVSDACTRCEHAAEGVVQRHLDIWPGAEVVAWEAPPADCACVCHEGWRIVNRVPATRKEAA